MTTPASLPPESCPPSGQHIPAWDTTHRWLVDHKTVVESMIDFWTKLEERKQWYAEIRGLLTSTIVFTYLRTGRYGDYEDYSRVVKAVESGLGHHVFWNTITDIHTGKLSFYARSEAGFNVCVMTPYTHIDERLVNIFGVRPQPSDDPIVQPS